MICIKKGLIRAGLQYLKPLHCEQANDVLLVKKKFTFKLSA